MRAGAAHRGWPDVGSPGSRPRSFCTCQVLRPRRAVRTLRWCVRNVLPSALETARAVRHKSVDLDGVGALDLDRFELRILNDEVVALGHLVAAAFVLGGDRLAGLFIDELLAQAIAGGLVDLPEGDALGTRAGRMERNRTGDQSQFEIAFPVGTHNQLLWFSVYACEAVCRGKDAVFISEASFRARVASHRGPPAHLHSYCGVPGRRF